MNGQNSTTEINPFLIHLSAKCDIGVNMPSPSTTDILPIDMQFNSGHVVSISMYTVLCVLSAVGNITVLTAILRKRQHREILLRMDLLLLNLTIADLMVTFFMMPLEIAWAAIVEWKAGDFMCRIMAFFRIFGLYLSGFQLVCLALDRYWAVRYPMQGRASTKRAKWMAISAWFLACLCSIPQTLIFHVERHPVYTWFTQCVTYNASPEPRYELAYNMFVMGMMYVLPLVLIVVLYSSIVVELWKKQVSSRSTFDPQVVGSAKHGVDSIDRAKVKSIQMTFIIAAAFLICWTPYYVMCIWYWTDPETAKNVDQRIQRGLFIFASTNSTANPIVYGLFHIKSMFCRENTRQSFERSMRSTNRRSTTPASIDYNVNAVSCTEALRKVVPLQMVLSGNVHGLEIITGVVVKGLTRGVHEESIIIQVNTLAAVLEETSESIKIGY